MATVTRCDHCGEITFHPAKLRIGDYFGSTSKPDGYHYWDFCSMDCVAGYSHYKLNEALVKEQGS